jgi:hypothetical protein
MEPSRRTVSEFVACIRRATRDGRQRPPPASRARCFLSIFLNSQFTLNMCSELTVGGFKGV